MADHLKDTFAFGTSLGLVLLCLMLLMMGCTAGPEPNPEGISVRGDVVTGPTGTCTVGSQPAEDLRSCGLTAAERERALSLLLAQQSVQQAHSAANRPSQQELLWTARTLYSETKKPYEMELVAAVVLNRRDSPRYPDTVERVVQEEWQFTGIHRGTKATQLTLDDYRGGQTEWRLAVRISHHMLTLPDSLRPLQDVTHFYSPVSVDHEPNWARGVEPRYSIGDRFEFYQLHASARRVTNAR